MTSAGWSHADPHLSCVASTISGEQRYVCIGRSEPGGEPMAMLADGKHDPLYLTLDRPIYDGHNGTMSVAEFVDAYLKPALATWP